MSPNAVLQELRERGISSKQIAARAQLCGMEIKGPSIYGETHQWAVLRSAFTNNDFTDLIFGGKIVVDSVADRWLNTHHGARSSEI